MNLTDRIVAKVDSIADLADVFGVTDGKVVMVTGYHAGTTSGGGPFVRKSSGRHNGGTFIDPLRPFPTDWNDQTQLEDWFEDSGVDVAGFKRVIEGKINASWFGAKFDYDADLQTGTDDSDALQKFADYGLNGLTNGVEKVLPDGHTYITKPIWLYEKDGFNLSGQGEWNTKITPSETMDLTLPSEFLAINGVYRGYEYDVKSCFIIASRRVTGGTDGALNPLGANAAAWYYKFKGIGFHMIDNGNLDTYGIYAPEIGHFKLEDIFSQYSRSTVFSNDIYRATFKQYTVANSYIPFDHGAKGASVDPRGTSLTLDNCGATRTLFGWKFKNLSYSSGINTTIDSWAYGYTGSSIVHYAYDFENCQFNMVGCGAESEAGTAFGLFNVHSGSSVEVSGGAFIGGNVSESLTAQSFVDGALTKLTLDRPLLIQGATSHLDVDITNGASVSCRGLHNRQDIVGGSLKYTDFNTDSSSIFRIESYDSLSIDVKRDSNLSAVSDSFQRISWDLENIDNFDAVTGDSAVIPYRAKYRISINIAVLGDGFQYGFLDINSTLTVFNGFENSVDPDTTSRCASFSWVGYLDKGDIVKAGVRTGVGVTIDSYIAEGTSLIIEQC